MKRLMFAGIVFAMMTGMAVAAQTPWNRAIGSQGALRSYCMEQSTRAMIGVWGSDDVVAISNGNQYVWVYSADPLKLADAVSVQGLGFGVVAGSTSRITKTCQFFNQNQELMFSGDAEGKIIQTGGSSTVVWKDLIMQVPTTVRIPLPKEYGWGYVYLVYTDDNGNLRYVYLGDGTVFDFPSAFAGLKGGARLMIRGYTPDGFRLEQIIDLGNGDYLPITEYLEDFNSIVMDGVEYSTDQVVSVIPAQNSVGESPLFQMESTGSKPIMISVKTSEGESPLGFYYRQVGGSGAWASWQYQAMISPNGCVINLPAGTYHFDFDWSNLHSETWRNFQWWNGSVSGGKGI